MVSPPSGYSSYANHDQPHQSLAIARNCQVSNGSSLAVVAEESGVAEATHSAVAYDSSMDIYAGQNSRSSASHMIVDGSSTCHIQSGQEENQSTADLTNSPHNVSVVGAFVSHSLFIAGNNNYVTVNSLSNPETLKVSSTPLQSNNLSEISASAFQPEHSLRKSFISKLKNHYLNLNTLTILTPQGNGELEREIPLASLYTNLAMIGDDERKERKEGLESFIDGRLPTYETIFKAKKEIKPGEMFQQEKLQQAPKKRVVVYGSAGIGKSTFVSYAIHAWAEGKLWPEEFEVVLCIRLRNLSKSFFPIERGYTYTPYDFLKREHEAIQLDFQELLNDPEVLSKTLLILDGYDELPNEVGSNKGHLYPTFEALKKLFPHILITSRPGSIALTCSCEFEILGFNDTQIEKYMAAFFSHFQGGKSETAQELRAYLDKTPLAKSLSHIPINLTMLCSLFQENPNLFEAETSLTITRLYDEIVNHFFKLFLFKIGKGNDDIRETPPDLHHTVVPLKNVLEQCAIQAVKNKSLYTDLRFIVEKLAPEKIELSQLKQIGLFKIENKKGSFIHLTFQEYFAASYVARLYKEGKRSEAQEILKGNKFKPHFSLVWRMTTGILSLQGNIKRLQEFFNDLFTAPNDLSVRTELELIAGCFEECPQRENITQYGSFITACEEYVEKFIALEDFVGLVFSLLGPNSSLLHHLKMVKLITDLCQSAHSNKMHRVINNLVEAGQSLSKEALEALMQFLLDPKANSLSKQAGAYALGKIFEGGGALPKEALDALIQLLIDPKTRFDVKRLGTEALGKIAQGGGALPKEALDALIQLLIDPKTRFDVKQLVTEALGKIAQGGGTLSKAALKALMQLLLDPQADSYAQRAGAKALGQIAQGGGALPKEALKALMQLILDPQADSDAKRAGADALGAIAHGGGVLAKEALEALIQLIRDPQANSYVKGAGAEALGTIAQRGGVLPQEALEALMQLILDPQADSDAKYAGAEALSMVAEGGRALFQDTLEALIQLLSDPKANSYAKLAGVQALRSIAQEGGTLAQEALKALIKLLRDPKANYYAKLAGPQALGAIAQGGGALAKEALEALIQLLRDPQANHEAKWAGAEALGAIARGGGILPEEVLEILIQLLLDPKANSSVKRAGAEALVKIAQGEGALPQDALKALIPLLEDRKADYYAKRAGAEALGAIAQGGGALAKEALEVLMELLLKPQVNSSSKWAGAQASRAIAQRRGALPKEALEALIQLLLDPKTDSSAKQAGAEALGAIAQRGEELSKELSKRFPEILQETQVISSTYPYLVQILMKFSTDTIISQIEQTPGLDIQFCLFNGFALSLENGRLCIWDRDGRSPSSECFRPPLRISSDSSSSSVTPASLSQAPCANANPPGDDIQTALYDQGELCQALLKCYQLLHSVTQDVP